VLLRRSSSFGGGIDLRVLEARPTGELGNERVTPLTATATLLEGVPVAKEPSSIIKEPLVLTGNGDTRIAPSQWTAAATADNKIRSIHELALRRASVTADDPASDPQTKSLSPSEVDMHLAQMTANIAGSAVSLTPTANMPSAPLDLATTTVIAAVAVSAEGAGQGQAFAGQGSLTGGAETSQVLSAPDPKLTFGERVQAFADAVAQRVLGQIRNENWSVSLQLDPANLGAMEIDLTLRGNAVTANLGVANAEVRALLEAGLPRLKESLEASGLQLANWSFGQSGSRGFGESMPTPFAWQPLRGVPDDADSSADASRLAAMRHNEGSRSAVDLFV
jgi:flagellar hook-length control protein FliK